MGQNNQREFLEEILDAAVDTENIKEDQIFEKYANKSLPKGLAKTAGTLTAYSGPWTKAEVIHLLRRTTFGVRPTDVQVLLGKTPGDAVDYLFSNVPATAPAPPVNNYYNGGYTDPTGIGPSQTWINAPFGDGTVNSKRMNSLSSWWMGLILNQNLSILEKMTWFWHNHFATELSIIGDSRAAYIHHAMLRENALGNFKDLTKKVTKDPAMLIYLNGRYNTKSAPDENYGRELQELFTVSKYNSPNYTEDDVKAAAKALTGWQVNLSTIPVSSFFSPSRHDSSNKQLSSFYNNSLMPGLSGTNGSLEADELIDTIFNQAPTQAARWICTKLYRYFVYYDTVTDPSVSATIIAGMTTQLISSNWDVVPAIKLLLKSQHFFDANSRGCSIRTPLDFFAGIFRTFQVVLPGSFDAQKNYAIWNTLRSYAAANGLDLGEPPNVSGFPAYYQSPEFAELWINSNSLPKRLQFVDMMLSSGFTAGTGTAIKLDVLAFVKTCPNADDPVMLVQYCCDYLLGIDLLAARKDSIKVSTLLSGQTTNNYWTQAWQTYLATPNTANTNIVKTRINSLLTELMHAAEHHLC